MLVCEFDLTSCLSVPRFNTKYFGAELGFFIQGVNDVFGDFALDKSFWEILDGDLKQTPVGG